MPYIRHESLFSLQDLYHLDREKRFDLIFATIELAPILRIVNKKSRLGASAETNYSAMVYSLIARIIERIPTIKDLLKRLREDVLFRLDCGFSLAESIPSASTYSRLIQKFSQSEALEEVSQNVIKLAFEEGFIPDDTLAIDATHIEARDRARKKQAQEKERTASKKRGYYKNKGKKNKNLFLERRL